MKQEFLDEFFDPPPPPPPDRVAKIRHPKYSSSNQRHRHDEWWWRSSEQTAFGLATILPQGKIRTLSLNEQSRFLTEATHSNSALNAANGCKDFLSIESRSWVYTTLSDFELTLLRYVQGTASARRRRITFNVGTRLLR